MRVMPPPKRHRPERTTPSDWLRLAIPFIGITALLLLAWHLGYFNLENPNRLTAAAAEERRTPWIGPIFVAVLAVSAALAVPITPLAYIGGALFGLARGELFVWIGCMLGGTSGYWLARSVWASPARKLLARYQETFQALREGKPFLTTLRTQLTPFMPFGAFNYAAAVTRLPFIPFIIGSALGIIPNTTAIVFVGDRIMAGLHGADKTPLWIGAGVAVGLVALTFVPTVIKRLRR